MSITKRSFTGKAALQWSLNHLPKIIRYPSIRSMIRLRATPPEGIHFKIADTAEELIQGFNILYHAYVEAGLMKPDPSELRITPYHLLPTTTTLVAKHGSRVVGLVSLIRQGAFGLPSEKAFDLSELKASGRQIAEISAVAIRPEWRGKLFLPLVKYGYEYCTRYFGIETFICSSDADSPLTDFYEGVVRFKKFSDEPCATYDFAARTPVMGQFLHLDEAYDEWKRIYSHRPLESNLFSYFTELKWNCFEFPKRDFYSCLDPVLTPEILEVYFTLKPGLGYELSPFQRTQLKNIYHHPSYQKVWDRFLGPMISIIDKRTLRDFRFPSLIPGMLLHDGQSLAIDVLNVSAIGLQARMRSGSMPSLAPRYEARLQISPRQFVDAAVQPAWANPKNGLVGFQVTRPSAAWNRFLSALEKQILSPSLVPTDFVEEIRKAA